MANIELVIKISEMTLLNIASRDLLLCSREDIEKLEFAIKNGTPLPKGHGRLIDISKIEEDRVEKDNPIIYLTIDGNYTEAISLDYLNNLSTIIEADKVGSEVEE